MKATKKGIRPKENTQTHINDNRLNDVCLIVFYVGFVLFGIGQYIHNTALWGFGIGMTFAMMIMQFILHPIEED
jgi:cyanate permease